MSLIWVAQTEDGKAVKAFVYGVTNDVHKMRVFESEEECQAHCDLESTDLAKGYNGSLTPAQIESDA